MTEGGIAKKIFFFSVPLILGNLLQQLYNTVDSIIVGNFVGSNALAAVGSSTSIICLLIAFSQGLAVGRRDRVAASWRERKTGSTGCGSHGDRTLGDPWRDHHSGRNLL